MKAVKDKDALQKNFDSWSASSKNLWKLIDCGMSSTVNIMIGYGIQSNAEVLGYEEEISRGIFAFRETDAGYYDIPLYSRFKQVEYKGVPHPLSGDYTPREQEDIDDSLYEYGKYGPQPQSPSPTESDLSSTVYSTCQSNDSDGEQGAVSDHSVNDDPIHDHIPIPSIEQVTIATQKTQPQVPKPQQTVDPKFAQIPKKCFSKQSSPVNRHFSRNTAYKSNKYAVKGKMGTAVKTSAGCVWRKAIPLSNTNSRPTPDSNVNDHPLKHMEHRGIFDSGCSGHMTGNRAHLEDYQELSKVGSVTFGGSKGSISGKGTIRLGNLVFDDVAFVKELGHFNLFSISQICDKKLNVLFTEKECFVVSSDFKMPDENQVLLKVPRQHNMYTFDMKNVDSSKGYTCLLAKASSNEAKLWHRRLGHLNFKNLNKLVKDNLVRGLPSKSFKNDHTCVACQKGKQHKASCKAKIDRYVTHPLHTLHMDLFGPTSVRSINHASYCLVITDDYSRFCWVFFLAKKDETSDILKTFIRQIENQLNQKVKIIRSDNGTEFKNRVMLEFCGEKGIKQEFSNARTPQQNGVAERMNRTLIEAARTMQQAYSRTFNAPPQFLREGIQML
ncbi:putative ribonuclease H-like domain-containing protein [Tanacetum coccineum]